MTIGNEAETGRFDVNRKPVAQVMAAVYDPILTRQRVEPAVAIVNSGPPIRLASESEHRYSADADHVPRC